MFASVDTDVALIGALAAVLVAGIGGVFTFINARSTKNAIGKPNGHGNVVEMTERILMELGRLHEKVDEHEIKDERNFADIARRFDLLETTEEAAERRDG